MSLLRIDKSFCQPNLKSITVLLHDFMFSFLCKISTFIFAIELLLVFYLGPLSYILTDFKKCKSFCHNILLFHLLTIMYP